MKYIDDYKVNKFLKEYDSILLLTEKEKKVLKREVSNLVTYVESFKTFQKEQQEDFLESIRLATIYCFSSSRELTLEAGRNFLLQKFELYKNRKESPVLWRFNSLWEYAVKEKENFYLAISLSSVLTDPSCHLLLETITKKDIDKLCMASEKHYAVYSYCNVLSLRPQLFQKFIQNNIPSNYLNSFDIDSFNEKKYSGVLIDIIGDGKDSKDRSNRVYFAKEVLEVYDNYKESLIDEEQVLKNLRVVKQFPEQFYHKDWKKITDFIYYQVLDKDSNLSYLLEPLSKTPDCCFDEFCNTILDPRFYTCDTSDVLNYLSQNGCEDEPLRYAMKRDFLFESNIIEKEDFISYLSFFDGDLSLSLLEKRIKVLGKDLDQLCDVSDEIRRDYFNFLGDAKNEKELKRRASYFKTYKIDEFFSMLEDHPRKEQALSLLTSKKKKEVRDCNVKIVEKTKPLEAIVGEKILDRISLYAKPENIEKVVEYISSFSFIKMDEKEQLQMLDTVLPEPKRIEKDGYSILVTKEMMDEMEGGKTYPCTVKVYGKKYKTNITKNFSS